MHAFEGNTLVRRGVQLNQQRGTKNADFEGLCWSCTPIENYRNPEEINILWALVPNPNQL